ncbi:TlpA family protein disulfide reductase [bacterium]|nr:TlpA family protein disulfide reductase [bacterium]
MVGVLLGALILVTNTPIQKTMTIGTMVDEITFQSLNQVSMKLSQFRGKVVVLNFWATWCVPCRNEMQLLQDYSNQLDGKIIVIGINSQESEEDVSTFLRIRKITFPIALDSSGEVIRKFAIQGYPTTYFLDANGVIRAQHIGELRDDLMRGYLTAAGVQP